MAHDDVLVEVELVDDDEPGPVPPDEPGRPRPGGPRVLVLVALAMVAVAVIASVLLRPGPPQDGAVRSLDTPLRAQWQTAGTVLGVVGDDVVVQSDIFRVREVRVIDAATGAERWSVRLGSSGLATTCATAVTAEPPAVWCVRNLRVVTDPLTGESTTQEPALLALSLVDGTVLAEQAVRVPSAGFVAVDDDVVLADRDGARLTVQRVDPAGWQPVWTTELDLLPRTTDGQMDALIESSGDLLIIRGPTMAVLRASDGAVLDRWEPVVDPLVRTLEAADIEVTATGFAAWADLVNRVRAPQATWYDLDGAQVLEFEGRWAEPSTTDGTGAHALLVSRQPGQVTAVDVPGGRDLWSAPAAGGAVLRYDEAVVLADGDSLTSIEVVSGLERWSAQVPGLRPGAGAVTDGRSMAVLSFGDTRWRMAAIDLRNGAVTWSTSAPGIPEITEEVNLGGQARLSVVGADAVINWGRTMTWAR